MTPEQIVALLTLLADLRMQIGEQARTIADLEDRLAEATAERT